MPHRSHLAGIHKRFTDGCLGNEPAHQRGHDLHDPAFVLAGLVPCRYMLPCNVLLLRQTAGILARSYSVLPYWLFGILKVRGDFGLAAEREALKSY